MEASLGLVRPHPLLQLVEAQELDMRMGHRQRLLQMESLAEAVVVEQNMDPVVLEAPQRKHFPLMQLLNTDSLVEIALWVLDMLLVPVAAVQVVQVVQ
jgi:hypothetical protein